MEFYNGIDLNKLLNQWYHYELLANKNRPDRDQERHPGDMDSALRKTIWQNIEKEYSRWELAGKIHGDIQSKNIMISPKGEIKFIDPMLYDEDGHKSLKSDDLGSLKEIKFFLIGDPSKTGI